MIMTAEKKRNIYILVLIVYLTLVGWLCFGNFSSAPTVTENFLGIPTDKIIHFLMFLPFPLILAGIFKGKTKRPVNSLLIVLAFFLAGCILAAGTEIGQHFTGYRVADSSDFFADGLGLAVGSLLAIIYDLKYKLQHD